ncbi:Flp family type IVb pilin [Clostridium sp. DL1XJH146]
MLMKMKNLFVDEHGQGMTEYGLVLGIVAIGIIAVLVLLRTQISALIQSIIDNLSSETPAAPAP